MLGRRRRWIHLGDGSFGGNVSKPLTFSLLFTFPLSILLPLCLLPGSEFRLHGRVIIIYLLGAWCQWCLRCVHRVRLFRRRRCRQPALGICQ